MARDRAQTEQVYERWIKEGRGQGSGRDYKPWLTVQDVASHGTSSNHPSRRLGRQLQLLSDLELNAVLEFEWNPEVVDIREQYPLDRDVTRAIAVEMHIDHPRCTKSGTEIVMTTDLLVYVKRARRTTQFARSVKYQSDLSSSSPRVIEKLELERRYWTRKGVDWAIITDEQISPGRAVNLRFYIGDPGLNQSRSTAYWENLMVATLKLLDEQPGMTISQLGARVEGAGLFPHEDFVAALHHLVRHRRLEFDMEREFTQAMFANEFTPVAPGNRTH